MATFGVRVYARRDSSVARLHTLLILAILGAAALAAPASASQGADPDSPNPLAGASLYVDHEAPSWQQWQSFKNSGQTAKADLIWKIAREPKNLWFGRFTSPGFFRKVREPIEAAKAAGQVPSFSVLRAQATSCGPNYNGGGAAEDRRTRAWYDDLARAIGDDRVVIAFEPDSLGTIDCLGRASGTTGSGCSATGSTRSRSCRTRRSTWRRARPTGSPPSGPPRSCARSASPRSAASC